VRNSTTVSGGTETAAADRIAMIAKALGHPARVKIIETLLARQSCIGCDIVDEIGLAASTTSEHLRILKEAGLITGEIARPRVCYSLAPNAVGPLLQLLRRMDAAPQSRLPAGEENVAV
jgi:ArsR family transcriptional regulator, arsenate/arsenite/antimonite-responsive transcriptional repressor